MCTFAASIALFMFCRYFLYSIPVATDDAAIFAALRAFAVVVHRCCGCCCCCCFTYRCHCYPAIAASDMFLQFSSAELIVVAFVAVPLNEIVVPPVAAIAVYLLLHLSLCLLFGANVASSGCCCKYCRTCCCNFLPYFVSRIHVVIPRVACCTCCSTCCCN